MTINRKIKFIDLFAGIGGIRKGFELAVSELGYSCQCVFTSEIKSHAVEILKQNNPTEKIFGDITEIKSENIPDFDFLLAGFPCQAFSYAGKRLGFEDTRGTLFFEVERILKDKKPFGFILENVEGLATHDKEQAKDKIGRTLKTILNKLEMIGYKTNWKILNSNQFGIPQDRKRIYIVGTLKTIPNLDNFQEIKSVLKNILEKNLPTSNSEFVKLILSHYSVSELSGKSIKDKRGGKDNIHSWDIEYKGKISNTEKQLLNLLLKERRKKKWAEEYGIDWMDGMPLTKEQIKTFFNVSNLEEILENLTNKKYLKKEHPKRKIGNKRVPDETLPLGYNIVAGKMSYEVGKILDENSISPTLTAMDMQHLFVIDGNGIRQLSLREGLRLFGYPDNFKFNIDKKLGYDLLGNTVAVPVISAVSKRVLSIWQGERP